MACHKIDNENRTVRLMSEVFTIDQNPPVQKVFWCKNGVAINTTARGRMSVNVSIKKPSLTIHNVNLEDAGSYRLTVISYAGPTEIEIVLGSIVFIVLNICKTL